MTTQLWISKLLYDSMSSPLLPLTNEEKERFQKQGYMSEHLLCLYSMASERTALFQGNFPLYFNGHGEADVILFGLADTKEDGLNCILYLLQNPVTELNIVSPRPLTGLAGIATLYADLDYHINLDRFDLEMRGNSYKDVRYSVHRADKMNYHTRISREFTQKHTYILSRHMANHKLDAWDFEELLSLERFFKEHNHGFMMEVYRDEELVGFDVIDFFEDKKIMVVPLGIYLDAASLADFLMYENIKYAKRRGYKWLDIGLACRNPGMQAFKEKWLAEPKYQLFVQTIKTKNRNTG
ncbi:hypothetical protein MUP77_20320 [Candidatus Bathyarchaeota archaeon]|nr:hypothetical protein [Candidatus Bathyarchaeota archaeon]